MIPATNLTFSLPLEGASPTLGQRFLRFTVIPVLLISILAPVVRVSETFWLKPDELLLPLIALIYIWLMLAGMARPVPPNAMYAVAFAFMICICLSMIYGTKVIGHPLLARDFFELPKTLFPVLFFTLAYEADLPEKTLRTLAAILVPAILLICLYAYAQWFNLGLTSYLQPLYSGGLHDEGSLQHYRRVYSTMGNPNTLGILMTWTIAAFTVAALLRVMRRFWIVVALIASLITLAMTGSRYGLIDTVFALVLIFLLPAPAGKSKVKRNGTLLIAIPLVLSFILIIAATNPATIQRFEMLGTPLRENSLRMRLDTLWLDAIEQFRQSPILGQGPARVLFSEIYTDSEYLQILKMFGILGFLAYICYFLVPLGMIWKGIKKVKWAGSSLEREWRGTYWGLCFGFLVPLTCLVMNIGMGTYYDTSLLAFTWMWMGIGASCAKRISQIADQQSA